MWVGCRCVLVSPSPKSQDHEVGEFVEASVNLTGSGACPVSGEAEKAATGGTWVAVT